MGAFVDGDESRPRFLRGLDKAKSNVTFLSPLTRPRADLCCLAALKGFHVIDATRLSDNTRVAIKRIEKAGRERHISQHIASIAGPDDHCVSAIETLPDSLDDHMELLVMPFLRRYDDPELQVVGEVLDFVLQMLKVSQR